MLICMHVQTLWKDVLICTCKLGGKTCLFYFCVKNCVYPVEFFVFKMHPDGLLCVIHRRIIGTLTVN